MASVKTITLPDGSSYDFKATYDADGNNISQTYINVNEKGAASGVAPLNSSGKIDESYLPTSEFVSESGSLVTFDYGKSGTPYSKLIVNIEPTQSGSGDPSPTNIRSITGWTTINMNVSGKNLFDQSILTDSSNWQYKSLAMRPNTTYICSTSAPKDSSRRIYMMRSDRAAQADTQLFDTQSLSVTTNSDGILKVQWQNTSDVTWQDDWFMIRFASDTNDSYETYIEPNVYSISTSPAGTVYAGTLDVLSGKLTVSMGVLTGSVLSSLNWTIPSGAANPFFNAAFSSSYGIDATQRDSVICNKYKTTTPTASTTDDYVIGFTLSGNDVRIRDTRYSDVSALKSSLSDALVVYPLNNPVTYQLTAAQVTTLLGRNNVWCDVGDIEVEVIPNEIINYIKSNALVVSQNSSSGELTLS